MTHDNFMSTLTPGFLVCVLNSANVVILSKIVVRAPPCITPDTFVYSGSTFSSAKQ